MYWKVVGILISVVMQKKCVLNWKHNQLHCFSETNKITVSTYDYYVS